MENYIQMNQSQTAKSPFWINLVFKIYGFFIIGLGLFNLYYYLIFIQSFLQANLHYKVSYKVSFLSTIFIILSTILGTVILALGSFRLKKWFITAQIIALVPILTNYLLFVSIYKQNHPILSPFNFISLAALILALVYRRFFIKSYFHWSLIFYIIVSLGCIILPNIFVFLSILDIFFKI